MNDEKSILIDSLAEAISNNPQAEALLDALIPDENSQAENTHSEKNNESPLDISTIFKIQNMMQAMSSQGNDDRSRLLSAIRPFMSEERKPHVDSAIKLLKIASLLKLAGELDLFKDFKL